MIYENEWVDWNKFIFVYCKYKRKDQDGHINYYWKAYCVIADYINSCELTE